MSSVSGATHARARRLESSCSRLNVSRAQRRTSAADRRASERRSDTLAAGRAGAIGVAGASAARTGRMGVGWSDIVTPLRLYRSVLSPGRLANYPRSGRLAERVIGTAAE